jgi:hypothetical protein
MKTYWDLSERERGELSSEQVEAFVDAELMSKGVLRPGPLVLLPVPSAPVPDANLFTLASMSHYDVYFRSEQDARAVAEMICRVQRKRLTPDDWSGPSALVMFGDDRDRTVQPVAIYTAGTYTAALDSIARAANANEENKKRTEEHEKAVEAQREALSSMWGDWHSCCTKARRMQKVRDTFAEYVRLCDGSETTAAKFLAKAFPQPEIEDARAWFGIAIPIDPDAKPLPAPRVEPRTDAEIPF